MLADIARDRSEMAHFHILWRPEVPFFEKLKERPFHFDLSAKTMLTILLFF